MFLLLLSPYQKQPGWDEIALNENIKQKIQQVVSNYTL